MIDEDEQTEDFIAALAQLQALQERRQATRRKIEQYKQLKDLLEPLRNPSANVQPDLVTKDGSLAEELTKTKALGMRVAAGIAKRNERGDDGGAY